MNVNRKLLILYLFWEMKVIVLAVLLVLASSQACDMSLDDRIDCGYMGIDQPQC